MDSATEVEQKFLRGREKEEPQISIGVGPLPCSSMVVGEEVLKTDWLLDSLMEYREDMDGATTIKVVLVRDISLRESRKLESLPFLKIPNTCKLRSNKSVASSSPPVLAVAVMQRKTQKDGF